MISQGLENLRQLVQRQPSLSSDSSDTESAYVTTDSKDGGQSRGRSKGRRCGDRTEKEVEQQGWILVDKGSKLNVNLTNII